MSSSASASTPSLVPIGDTGKTRRAVTFGRATVSQYRSFPKELQTGLLAEIATDCEVAWNRRQIAPAEPPAEKEEAAVA